MYTYAYIWHIYIYVYTTCPQKKASEKLARKKNTLIATTSSCLRNRATLQEMDLHCPATSHYVMFLDTKLRLLCHWTSPQLKMWWPFYGFTWDCYALGCTDWSQHIRDVKASKAGPWQCRTVSFLFWRPFDTWISVFYIGPPREGGAGNPDMRIKFGFLFHGLTLLRASQVQDL